jgi:uncharacterized membrane protein YvbJ
MVCPACGASIDPDVDTCPKCGVALTYDAARRNAKADGSEKGGTKATVVYAIVCIAAVAAFCWVILFWHESQVHSVPEIIAPGVSLSRLVQP